MPSHSHLPMPASTMPQVGLETRDVHSIDRWKQDASWKKSGEVIFVCVKITFTGAPSHSIRVGTDGIE